MSKGILIIDSGNRWWLERVLAAVFYTCAIFLVIKFIINVEFELAEWYYIRILKVLSLLIFILTLAVYYSLTKSFHFDLINEEYRVYYSIGPFGFGKWKRHLKFKFIVVFLSSNDDYLVNIWDVKNNRITVGNYGELEDANEFGALLSKELNIKFQERKK
jgi:hypothetical protein